MQQAKVSMTMANLITRVARKSPPRLPSIFHASAVASGQLKADEAQQRILPILDTIINDLPSYDEAMYSHAAVLHALETERETAVKYDEQLARNNKLLHRFRRLGYGYSNHVSSASLPNRYYNLPEPPHAPIPPRGVYLHGDVGCGKSLLMDVLFHCAKSCVQSSARVHYHAFMSSVYAMIHRYDGMTDRQREQMGCHHPLDAVVGQLGRANSAASGGGLLCFDEFQVADVADARLMHGIFHRLMNSGTIICFTANRAPSEVNRSQLQDGDFIPFLDLIHERCELVHVNSGIDYRERLMEEHIEHKRNEQITLSSNPDHNDNNTNTSATTLINRASSTSSNYLNASDSEGLRQMWNNITDGVDWDSVSKVILSVAHGRKLHLGRALPDGRAVQLSTAELIEAAIGANDYRALCKFSKNIFLTDVLPVFTNDTRNFARRFITFIDVCYEMKAKLFMRMEATSLNKMFNKIDVSKVSADVLEGMQFEGEVGKTGVGADNRNISKKSTLYTGEDEMFAFKRAISRLKEMQSDSFGKRSLFDVDVTDNTYDLDISEKAW